MEAKKQCCYVTESGEAWTCIDPEECASEPIKREFERMRDERAALSLGMRYLAAKLCEAKGEKATPERIGAYCDAARQVAAG